MPIDLKSEYNAAARKNILSMALGIPTLVGGIALGYMVDGLPAALSGTAIFLAGAAPIAYYGRKLNAASKAYTDSINRPGLDTHANKLTEYQEEPDDGTNAVRKGPGPDRFEP